MARGNKKLFSKVPTKQVVDNFCIECDKPAKDVMIYKLNAKSTGHRRSGIHWECEGGHINRNRKYKVRWV